MASSRDTSQLLLGIKALLSKRPKELGNPWETGTPKDHVAIDDGLERPFLLPLDLCSTPKVGLALTLRGILILTTFKDLRDVLRIKYTSRNLPGRLQVDHGHFTLWDWSETRRVKTCGEWAALLGQGDRRVKIAFAMSTCWGFDYTKCLRCRKPGVRKSFPSKFKTWYAWPLIAAHTSRPISNSSQHVLRSFNAVR